MAGQLLTEEHLLQLVYSWVVLGGAGQSGAGYSNPVHTDCLTCLTPNKSVVEILRRSSPEEDLAKFPPSRSPPPEVMGSPGTILTPPIYSISMVIGLRTPVSEPLALSLPSRENHFVWSGYHTFKTFENLIMLKLDKRSPHCVQSLCWDLGSVSPLFELHLKEDVVLDKFTELDYCPAQLKLSLVFERGRILDRWLFQQQQQRILL